MIVIDASTAAAWCFADEATAKTERALDRVVDEGAAVPALWPFEMANVLAVAERRGRIRESDATRLQNLLDRLPIAVEPDRVRIGALVASARTHDLTAYDAAYLDLAARLGAELATQDKALIRAARRSGVPLL